MLRELRFAVRMLLKQPGFSLIAVLTLALGIGATSAVFSLIQGVLLTPPPYNKPEQLMLLPAARTDGRKMDGPREWAAQQWTEWQKEAKSVEGIAAYAWTFNFLIRNDGSRSMQGMVVTKDYLPLLGLKTIAGRGFEDSDFSLGPTTAIVLGYEFWQRAFNGDPHIIGKTVRISRWDAPPTVVGVMQPGVRFLPSPGAAKEPNYNVNATVDFWAPSMPDPKHMKDPWLGRCGALTQGNGCAASTGRVSRAGGKRRAGRAAVRRVRTASGTADGRNESGWPKDSRSAAGSRSAGAADRMWERRSPAADAWTAAAAGIRSAGRTRHGPRCAFSTGLDRRLAAGVDRGNVRSRAGLWCREGIQADCRTCGSAAGWSVSGLGRVGVGIQRGGARGASRRDSSCTAGFPA